MVMQQQQQQQNVGQAISRSWQQVYEGHRFGLIAAAVSRVAKRNLSGKVAQGHRQGFAHLGTFSKVVPQGFDRPERPQAVDFELFSEAVEVDGVQDVLFQHSCVADQQADLRSAAPTLSDERGQQHTCWVLDCIVRGCRWVGHDLKSHQHIWGP